MKTLLELLVLNLIIASIISLGVAIFCLFPIAFSILFWNKVLFFQFIKLFLSSLLLGVVSYIIGSISAAASEGFF